MKFKAWMLTGLLSVGALSATALSATTVTDDHEVTEALRVLKTSSNSTTSVWPELEHFQFSLWRAMSMDPGPVTVVPIKQVPQALYAEDLTTDLSQQLETIKNSNIPKAMHAQSEYEQYISTVRKIIAHRISRQFPQARAYAKRGTLDEQYGRLMKKIQGVTASSTNTSNEEAVTKIENYLQGFKDNKSTSESKKNPFANGNQFIWATLIALIGFTFGLTAIKMNPEFFEKFISSKVAATFSDSTAPAATHTHQLNYARWLREFEELLAKLKTTQLTHERRIEEVYKHSEKLNQFATALSSDPRIKNEANLEYRMSNLLRELHQQLEQTNELKSGDRAQIGITLEHCLKLCDAIENTGIEYHRDQTSQPPQNNPNHRTG
jgi:hypothetical protein